MFNPLLHRYSFLTQHQQTAFENSEKRRNCSKGAISPFPTMFSTQSDNCMPIVHIFDIIFLFAACLEEPKIGIGGKGLTLSQTYPGFYVSAVQAL